MPRQPPARQKGGMAFPVQIVGAPGFDAYALSRDMDLMVMLTNWERTGRTVSRAR